MTELASIENDDITTVDASMNVKLLEVKLQIPGREPVDEEQGHGHVYDPHVWLDPSRTKIQMRAITNAFIERTRRTRIIMKKLRALCQGA